MSQLTKSLFASKTAWVGLITLVVGVANLFSGSEFIAAYPQVVAGAVALSGALGVVLRMLTTTPIK
jgi:hypothetical protein